jgi:hypothetical protein
MVPMHAKGRKEALHEPGNMNPDIQCRNTTPQHYYTFLR